MFRVGILESTPPPTNGSSLTGTCSVENLCGGISESAGRSSCVVVARREGSRGRSRSFMGELQRCSVGNGGHRLSSVMWSRLPAKITGSTESDCEHCHGLGTVIRSRTDLSRRARPGGRRGHFQTTSGRISDEKVFRGKHVVPGQKANCPRQFPNWTALIDAADGCETVPLHAHLPCSTECCLFRKMCHCRFKWSQASRTSNTMHQRMTQDMMFPRIRSPVTPSSTIGEGFRVFDEVNLV